MKHTVKCAWLSIHRSSNTLTIHPSGRFFSTLVLFCTLIAGCGSNPVHQPGVLLDAESYTHDGKDAYTSADWDRAQQLFTRALLLYQGIDHQPGILYSHVNLAEVALSLRDYTTSQEHLDLAADIANHTELQHIEARITLLYAQSALQQDHTSRAESILQPLLPEFIDSTPANSPDRIQMAAIGNRTRIAFAQKLDEALWTQRYANALKVSALKSPEMKARLLRFQADLLQQKGQDRKAEIHLQQALTLYKNTLYRPGIAATLSELGQFYMASTHWKDAQDYLSRSIAVFRYIRDLSNVIQVTEYLVIVEAELGNIERSKALDQWLVDVKAESGKGSNQI